MRWWMAVKRAIYRLGFRPPHSSVFHSPSLGIIYAWRDLDKERS